MKLFRKIIAVVCAALCLTGTFTVASCAMENEIVGLGLTQILNNGLDDFKIKLVAEHIAASLLGLKDNETVKIISDIDLDFDYNGDGKTTALEIAHVMANRAFTVPEILERYGEYTSDISSFKVVTTKDGVETVYISVPIEENLTLLNMGVFKESVEQLAKQQQAYADDDMTLMDYRHIAGELAMHAAVYAISVIFGGSKEDSPLHNYYNSAKVADLNIDESRVSPQLTQLIGTLTEFLIFVVYVVDVVIHNSF